MPNKPTEMEQRPKLHTETGDRPTLPMAGPPSHSVEELLNELRSHQIELEMQNEELQRIRTALEAAHNRYLTR